MRGRNEVGRYDSRLIADSSRRSGPFSKFHKQAYALMPSIAIRARLFILVAFHLRGTCRS